LGLHRAIVKSTTDPARRGRVLVAFPALKAEPAWAALCVTSRGPTPAFSPAVGDEVVVAFESGDISSPVCLGWLWNPESPPMSASSDDPPDKMRKPRAP
jgi:hypothetical protein